MSAIALYWFLVMPPFPAAEYSGAAFTRQFSLAPDALAKCKAEALIFCVWVGLCPELVEKLFGRPGMYAQFRGGPQEWWYLELGVNIYWPHRLLPHVTPGERIQGGIQ